MKNLAKSLLDNEEVSAIVNVKHRDIFSVLGIHKHPMTSGLIVRAFLPEALSVEVIDTKTDALVAELNQVDQAGLFEGKLGRKRNVFDIVYVFHTKMKPLLLTTHTVILRY